MRNCEESSLKSKYSAIQNPGHTGLAPHLVGLGPDTAIWGLVSFIAATHSSSFSQLNYASGLGWQSLLSVFPYIHANKGLLS